jgi:hypothetical protein
MACLDSDMGKESAEQIAEEEAREHPGVLHPERSCQPHSKPEQCQAMRLQLPGELPLLLAKLPLLLAKLPLLQ